MIKLLLGLASRREAHGPFARRLLAIWGSQGGKGAIASQVSGIWCSIEFEASVWAIDILKLRQDVSVPSKVFLR